MAEVKDEVWGLILDDMLPNESEAEEIRQKIKDASTYDWNKHKWKKPAKHKAKIKTGDIVSKSGVIAKVVDVDEDMICVQTETGIEVWSISDLDSRG